MFPVECFRNIPTPFYFYDLSLLQDTLDAVKQASSGSSFKVHYAVKANSNDRILRMIAAFGFGADTVSGGEIAKAIECGFDPADIVFAGVGKTDAEISEALRIGIGCFNVESAEELDIIIEWASRLDKVAPVALRVNPEIDAHTHHYITTGLAENKFGIAMSMIDNLVRKCVDNKRVDFRGLHFHIGSQITVGEPYEELCRRINHIVGHVESMGINIPIINVGGGLGIDYDMPDDNPIPDFATYFEIFRRSLKLHHVHEIHFELGRSIVGQCGSLISRVLYVKKGVDKQFVIIDAGFTDLIRPAFYQAHHKIENISSNASATHRYDVVGPICESSDVFGVDEILPITHRGDLLAIRSAGAYGEVMASQYNCRSLPGAYFIE